MEHADPGWVCGRANLPPTFAGTDTGCTTAATTIGERGAHGAVGHAHPENHATRTAASVATEGTAKAAQRMGCKVPVHASTGIF